MFEVYIIEKKKNSAYIFLDIIVQSATNLKKMALKALMDKLLCRDASKTDAVQKETEAADSNEDNDSIMSEMHRETWTGRFDFFLSALGYAVGLGAVWRFPYLCYRNGGGVFLIPYFVFLSLVGIPIVFLEMSVGQFTSTGPLTCWKMVPIFRGIGLCMNIVNGYLNIYYNMIIAYSCYFLVLSLTSQLPWEKCNPEWSSPSNGKKKRDFQKLMN